MEEKRSILNTFLSRASKNEYEYKIILRNGYQMTCCRIKKFDHEVIEVEDEKGKRKYVFREAISTIE